MKQDYSMGKLLLHGLQGMLIGLGAVLPGVSGGVLCVIFGFYGPIMDLLVHPLQALKKHMALLVPVLIGIGIGFLGIAKVLAFLLTRFETPSICLFAGLIFGMLPSLFREANEQGSSRFRWPALLGAFLVVLALLLGLKVLHLNLQANLWTNLFCGFCLALSIIAPGMSFSTLLMPLGLYTGFVSGIGQLDFSVLLPAGVGALLTVILCSRGVKWLLTNHYTATFHGIIGVVIAATLVIVPFDRFAASWSSGLLHGACLLVGVACALLLDRFNQRVEKKE